MPRGSVAPGGAWAPASRAMNAISSVSISHGLGSGAAAMPPTGADWHTTAGSLGLNGALVVKRKPSRSNVEVSSWSTPESKANRDALLQMQWIHLVRTSEGV